MASTGAGYDLSPTTFSPDGRIFQVEYATKAVENSGTVVGIRCADGVVLGVEKVMLSKMLLPSSNRRVATVSAHAGVAQAGLAADGRPGAHPALPSCSSNASVDCCVWAGVGGVGHPATLLQCKCRLIRMAGRMSNKHNRHTPPMQLSIDTDATPN